MQIKKDKEVCRLPVNNKNPLISVYITNHNYGEFVVEAIDSVLEQSFQDFELMIIDDGSTDCSRELILQYKDYEKIRIIFQDNKGLNETNNVALCESRGKYIIRLDADDYFQSDALLVLSTKLENNSDLAMVFPDYYYIDEQGNLLGQEIRHDFSKDVTLKDQPAHGACTMIRRSVLLDVGMYTEGLKCQDGYDIWLKITEKYSVSNVRLPLFYYRKHSDSLSSSSERIISTRSKIIKMQVEKLSRPKLCNIGVLPVRGTGIDSGCLAMEPLGDELLIDWTIKSALDSGVIDKLIVTTPDLNIIKHLRSTYGDLVLIHERNLELAAMTEMNLKPTLLGVLNDLALHDETDAVMQLSIHTPFMPGFYLEKALNVMRLMMVDIVIGVLQADEHHYNHDGTGMKAIGNNNYSGNLNIERKHIYKQIPGIFQVDVKHLVSNEMLLAGRVGHIDIDQKSAITVRSSLDMEIARSMVKCGI